MGLVGNENRIIALVIFFMMFALQPAQSAIPSCTNGITVLNNDSQAWLSLNIQSKRLHKNIQTLRNDLNDLLEMNADIGHADKTAKDIHKVLSKISPIMELVPSIQSGIDRTATAAEVAHKDVLGPVYKVTNTIVKATDLQQIVKILDDKVIPKLKTFEAKSSNIHLDAVKVTHDFSEACHVIETAEKLTCSAPGSKIIDSTYAGFRSPVSGLTRDVLIAAKAVRDVNTLLESDISPGMHIILDIHPPMEVIAKAVKEIEHLVHKFEEDLKKHIHIHIGAINVKFSIEYLLKEWKKEIRKLEHLLNVDKLKAEMRKEVEKVLHSIEHEMAKIIHKLEGNVKIHGLDLSGLEAALKGLEPHFNIKGPNFHFNFDSPFKEFNRCFGQ